jgi:hypothetical protein
VQELASLIPGNPWLRGVERPAPQAQLRIGPERALILKLEAASPGRQWPLFRPVVTCSILKRFEYPQALYT